METGDSYRADSSWITTWQVAQQLQVHPNTVGKWIGEGKIPAPVKRKGHGYWWQREWLEPIFADGPAPPGTYEAPPGRRRRRPDSAGSAPAQSETPSGPATGPAPQRRYHCPHGQRLAGDCTACYEWALRVIHDWNVRVPLDNPDTLDGENQQCDHDPAVVREDRLDTQRTIESAPRPEEDHSGQQSTQQSRRGPRPIRDQRG